MEGLIFYQYFIINKNDGSATKLSILNFIDLVTDVLMNHKRHGGNNYSNLIL
jgi:hypothetical protein